MTSLTDFLQVSFGQVLLLAGFGLFIGFDKMGFRGATVLFIPFLALSFGARTATGIVAPLYLIGEVFAVIAYGKMCNWKVLSRVIIWFLLGIGIGTLIGKIVSESIFQLLLGIILIFLLCLMGIIEFRKKPIILPDHTVILAPVGILAGFSTMIGNAAGSVISLFLLAKRMSKEHFLGTSTMIFIIVNTIKMPIHLFIWKTVNISSLKLDLFCIPFIAAGAVLGRILVAYIPEKAFRYVIMASCLIGAVRLLIN